MRISVITPSYNSDRFIADTIESIWKQGGNFIIEHIIADGGSKDNTIEILKKYENLLNNGKWPVRCQDIKYKWWSQRDNGQVDAINKGFSESSGEIVAWLNSDDIYLRGDVIQKVTEVFSNNPHIDIVVGNCVHINQEGKTIRECEINAIEEGIIDEDILKKLILQTFIPQPATFMRRRIWEKLGINDYYYVFDWDLWIRALKSDMTFYKINSSFAGFRVHDQGKTTIGGEGYLKEKLKIYLKHKIWSLSFLYIIILLTQIKIKNIPVIGAFLSKIIDKVMWSWGRVRRFLFQGSEVIS